MSADYRGGSDECRDAAETNINGLENINDEACEADDLTEPENEFTVYAEKSDEGKRLDLFVSECAELSRARVQKLIDEGMIVPLRAEGTAGGKKITKNYRICENDLFRITLPDPVPCGAQPENIPLDIVYEDDDLLIVNKPKGMVVHPAAGHPNGTLVNALLYHCRGHLSGIGGVLRPGIVHRIDRDTSGLLAVAKNDDAHISLSSQIKSHTLERRYETVALGNFRQDSGRIDAPIGRSPSDRKKMAVTAGGKPAVTDYSVKKRYILNGGAGSYTHLACQLETGRTHQIRVHLAHMGHRVFCDEVYGTLNRLEKECAHFVCGQCLHAASLTIVHPGTKEIMHFESELPDYFKRVLDKLENLSV